VICEKESTKAIDIYSIGMLMWEISSGQPSFINFNHDYDCAIYIVSDTPLEYRNLMVQCWDADPLKRPDAETLWIEFLEI
ncbi:10053_t:CDS:1, partial [Funneliformis geosporum]